MLKAKQLPRVLEQAVSQGVRSAALITAEGAVLAAAGAQGAQSDHVVGTIVGNVWHSFAEADAAGRGGVFGAISLYSRPRPD